MFIILFINSVEIYMNRFSLFMKTYNCNVIVLIILNFFNRKTSLELNFGSEKKFLGIFNFI